MDDLFNICYVVIRVCGMSDCSMLVNSHLIMLLFSTIDSSHNIPPLPMIFIGAKCIARAFLCPNFVRRRFFVPRSVMLTIYSDVAVPLKTQATK